MNELNYCKDCQWMHARWERKGVWFAKVHYCSCEKLNLAIDPVTGKKAIAGRKCEEVRSIKRRQNGSVEFIYFAKCPLFEGKQFARPRQDIKPAPALPHRSFAPPRPIPTPEPPPRQTHSFVLPKTTPMHEPPPRQSEKED